MGKENEERITEKNIKSLLKWKKNVIKILLLLLIKNRDIILNRYAIGYGVFFHPEYSLLFYISKDSLNWIDLIAMFFLLLCVFISISILV